MSLGDFDEILLGNTTRDLCGFVSWRRVGRFVLTWFLRSCQYYYCCTMAIYDYIWKCIAVTVWRHNILVFGDLPRIFHISSKPAFKFLLVALIWMPTSTHKVGFKYARDGIMVRTPWWLHPFNSFGRCSTSGWSVWKTFADCFGEECLETQGTRRITVQMDISWII